MHNTSISHPVVDHGFRGLEQVGGRESAASGLGRREHVVHRSERDSSGARLGGIAEGGVRKPESLVDAMLSDGCAAAGGKDRDGERYEGDDGLASVCSQARAR